jgi:hypothetical protein
MRWAFPTESFPLPVLLPGAAAPEALLLAGNMYIVDRSYVVDEEMGAVNVFCRFGNSTGMPDPHTFRLVNGRYRWIHTLSVNLTGKPIVIPKKQPED